MIPGIDAASPPTLAQAQAAYAQGYRWCGFYPNGQDGDEDPYETWSTGAVDILRQAGIVPLPIFVPKPDLASDPVDAANEWVAVGRTYRCACREPILYDGPHLVNTGLVTGPVWLLIWAAAPTSVGAGNAIQWGSTNIQGWSVDVSSAANDFPFGMGIVVDFEHNTVGGTTGAQWYTKWQQQILALANPAPEPVPTWEATLNGIVIMNDGKAQYLVNLSERTKMLIASPQELGYLVTHIPAITGACPMFLGALTPVG